jgi:ABC-type multidrug transport system permease subunit
VPRYLMPAWLQSASWWTPNAWIIHGLEQSTLAGIDPLGLLRTIAVLGAVALVSFALTVAVA